MNHKKTNNVNTKTSNRINQKRNRIATQKHPKSIIKKSNTKKGVDMLNLIYYMIEGQNLVYKRVEMLKLYLCHCHQLLNGKLWIKNQLLLKD